MDDEMFNNEDGDLPQALFQGEREGRVGFG
jgi:hypothetical protein